MKRILLALAIVAVAFAGVLFVVFNQAPLIEQNELSHRIQMSGLHERIAASSLNTRTGNTLCVIFDTKLSPLDLGKIKGNPTVIKIKFGMEQPDNDYEFGTYYKVIILDEVGSAEVWNFDYRLFEFTSKPKVQTLCAPKEKLVFDIAKEFNDSHHATAVNVVVIQ